MIKIRIKMLQTVKPCHILALAGDVKPGTVLHADQEYDAVSNPHGAISGICENGEKLGVRPEEFEFLQAPADLLVIHGKVKKDSFLYGAMKVSEEIHEKQLTRMDFLLEIMKTDCYCQKCFADDVMYLDPTGKRPAMRCPWCGYKISLRALAKRARRLPSDYLERAVQAYPTSRIRKEQIGDDLWVTNGYIAEIAGDEKFGRYPDRDGFMEFDIHTTLAMYDEEKYELAIVQPQTYRRFGNYIAILKSENYTTYVQEDFIENIVGTIFKIYIAGPLEPVYVILHGKPERIILPYRFDPDSGASVSGENDTQGGEHGQV